MNTFHQIAVGAACMLAVSSFGIRAQEPASSFEKAAQSMQQKLEERTQALVDLRNRITDEKLPLSRQLSALEGELTQAKRDYEEANSNLTVNTLDLTNLTDTIERQKSENRFLATNLGEYIRNFESRIHVTEQQRYKDDLRKARLAMDNSRLSDKEVFAAQAAMVQTTMDRVEDVAGGARFKGAAVDSSGLLNDGTVVLLGPAALFRSDGGIDVGTAEQQVNSVAPSVLNFTDPADSEAALDVAATGTGEFPLDPSGGNAHKMAATQESFVEHVQKGGPVMIPIFIMAGAALLVALWKWIGMMLIRRPSSRRINDLLVAINDQDLERAQEEAVALRGPVGTMLRAGVDHLGESRELIEEVMYEKVLTARLKLQRFLPFIAVCAAAAPLLGLLGTVTGIINTFKLITVFGSGDVKTLSGGISEALITTKFGLIVAIPSLLIHAYLSRKARAVVSRMETAAVGFVNQVAKTSWGRTKASSSAVAATGPGATAPDPDLVREQVQEILAEMLDKPGRVKGSAPA